MQSAVARAIAQIPAPEDGTLEWLPVAAIHRGHYQPRRFFDPAKMTELVESVRRSGVIQPIAVRALEEGRYEIIAGERRWRAAREVGLEEIPAFVRDVDEATAIEMALAENLHRDDLVPSEEAQKARDLLTLCKGDRQDAAKRLGWSLGKLDSRLALLHCTPAVLDALDNRTIALGHGELFATLTAEVQDATLPRVLELGISVAQLRERVGQTARPLVGAIFDLAGCGGCAHNSERQLALFDTNIGAGMCSNPKCHREKTLAALDARKAGLAAQYGTVALDTERTAGTFAVLERSGPEGVGSQQLAEGCRQCANYGVLMATAPGHEGKLTEDVCFDLRCREGKQQAYRALVEPPKAAPGTPAPQTAEKPKGTGGKNKDEPAKLEAPKTQATPNRVNDAIDRSLRRIAGDLASDDPRVSRAVSLYALARDAGYPSSATLGLPALPSIPSGRAKAIRTLILLDESQCADLHAALVRYVLADKDAEAGSHELTEGAAAAIFATGTELAMRFRVDAAFLKAHVKAGLDALLHEAGFSSWFDRKNGEAQYARLAGKKIAEIVAAATAEGGFDWTGFVPRSVAERVKTLAKRA